MGFHQKLALSTSSVDRVTQSSALATLLVEEWAWGHLSTPMIQKIAMAAKIDMEQLCNVEAPQEITSIASIGSHGRYPGHTHRDLTKYRLVPPCLSAAVSVADMWVREGILQTAKSG